MSCFWSLLIRQIVAVVELLHLSLPLLVVVVVAMIVFRLVISVAIVIHDQSCYFSSIQYMIVTRGFLFKLSDPP